MGDEQGGGADLQLDPPDLVPQLHPDLGVQGRQRFVEQQHLRFDGQRPGQRDPLLLAAGELVGVPVGLGARPTRSRYSPAIRRRSALPLPRSRRPNATFSRAVMCGNSE